MESSPSPESAAPTPKEKAEIRASAGADESETREKNGSFVQPDGIEAAIEAFNSRISIANRSTRFKVSEETGDIQIQIVDVRTDEVIRSIPSDESLKIAARFRELAGNAVGALVDTSS
jgi:flagellar protein FlaG